MRHVTTPATHKFADIGAKIRSARKRKGLSQESLAPLVGTTRRHLIRLENGEHEASPELADRIAEQLDADASDFRVCSSDDDEEESLADALAKVVRALRSEMRSEVAA